MKFLLSITLSLTLCFFGNAKQSDVFTLSNCRDYIESIDPELPPTEQVRLDLLNGNWNKQGSIAKWEFQADGIVHKINKGIDGAYKSEAFQWDLALNKEQTFLLVKKTGGQSPAIYFVEQTCEGIELLDIDSEETILLSYQKNTAQYAHHQKHIKGHWETTLNSNQIASLGFANNISQIPTKASIALDFYADGTFAQSIKSSDSDFKKSEEGRWSISKDGQFLLLTDLSGTKRDRCIPIKYLELDELVLSQVVPMASGKAETKGIYFNKY